MKKIIGIALFISALMVGQAMAFSLPTGKVVELKYKNWEQLVGANGQEKSASDGIAVGDTIWGLIRLTSIDTQGGSPLWSPLSSGEEITGYFSGLTVSSITQLSATSFEVGFSGGQMDFYLDSTPENADPNKADYSSFTDGVHFLSADFNYGIVPGDSTTTQYATVNALTSPLSGTGFFYLDVTGGDYAALFDSDFFTVFDGSKRDVSGRSDIAVGSGVNTFGFTYASNDPATAMTVPEPSTLLLLGAGLLGLGAFARRRKQ